MRRIASNEQEYPSLTTIVIFVSFFYIPCISGITWLLSRVFNGFQLAAFFICSSIVFYGSFAFILYLLDVYVDNIRTETDRKIAKESVQDV